MVFLYRNGQGISSCLFHLSLSLLLFFSNWSKAALALERKTIKIDIKAI